MKLRETRQQQQAPSQSAGQSDLSSLRVEVVDTISAIPEAAWDALAGEELFHTHRWQRLAEAHLCDYCPRYALAYRRGQIVAAIIETAPPPPYFFMKNLPPRVQPLFERLVGQVTTLCATPFNYRLNGLLIRPGELDKAALLAALMSAWDGWATRRKRSVQVYLSAQGSDSLLHREFVRRGYTTVPASSYAMLQMGPWESFDAYLRFLPRKKRKEVRRELRRAAERDVTIRCLRPQDVTAPDAELYRLLNNVLGRHDVLRPWLDQEFFSTVRTELNENALYFLAYVRDRLVGFVLGLHDRHTLNFQIIGLDYAPARKHGVYFLFQYEVIRQAIARNFGAVYMGTTTLDVKRRLGYRIHHRYYFLHSSRRLLDRALQTLLRYSQVAANWWLGKDL